MSTLTAKVCVIGDFAVGKTSTIERFVSNHFSDKYLTTVGVKIDTKDVRLEALGCDIKLVIWDVAGTERFGALEFSYLRGAAGCLLVADGTRAATVRAALNLKTQVTERYGDLPFAFLLNKNDLADSWDIDEMLSNEARAACDAVYETSAKTGAHVQQAIEGLAAEIAARELSG